MNHELLNQHPALGLLDWCSNASLERVMAVLASAVSSKREQEEREADEAWLQARARLSGVRLPHLYVWPDGEVAEYPFEWKSDDYFLLDTEDPEWRSLVLAHFGDTRQARDVTETVEVYLADNYFS